MNPKPVYVHLATLLQAAENCQQSDNVEWLGRHLARAEQLVKAFLPSGSGWDLGTKLNTESYSVSLIRLYGEFHHMDDHGGYDGWTAHDVLVTPSLVNEFDLKITGRNRNDVKDYLHELFDAALRVVVQLVPVDPAKTGPDDEYRWQEVAYSPLPVAAMRLLAKIGTTGEEGNQTCQQMDNWPETVLLRKLLKENGNG